jgi:hypothetical protein
MELGCVYSPDTIYYIFLHLHAPLSEQVHYYWNERIEKLTYQILPDPSNYLLCKTLVHAGVHLWRHAVRCVYPNIVILPALHHILCITDLCNRPYAHTPL